MMLLGRSHMIVLMFHGLQERNCSSPFDTSARMFKDYLEIVTEMRSMGDGSQAMITFDDGNASDVELALRELVAHDIRATFFIVPSLVGTEGYLTWDDVVLLKGYGMTIGSHTWSHRNLALCDRQSVVRELVQSKTHIEAMLGSNVDLLALPGGFAPKGIARYASEAGYSHVFTSQPGYWDGVSYLVPRVCIRNTLAPAELRKLLTGQRSAYLIHEQVKYHMRTLVGPRTFLAAYDVWQRWHGGTVQ